MLQKEVIQLGFFCDDVPHMIEKMVPLLLNNDFALFRIQSPVSKQMLFVLLSGNVITITCCFVCLLRFMFEILVHFIPVVCNLFCTRANSGKNKNVHGPHFK
jgi:hypothetical protein